MKEKTIFAFLLAFGISIDCVHAESSSSQKPKVVFSLEKISFQIGETAVQAQARQFGDGRLTMVNLHDDENAAVEAGVTVLERAGGRLIELTHSGKRRVVFSLDGQQYSFDPNRIFSKAGVRKTVRNENREAVVPERAFAAVDRFGAQFLKEFKLNRERAIITLHNNDDGGLSIHTYEPGGEWEADTDELHVGTNADPDDFFFVTSKRIFEELKKQDFNVILQDNSIKRDDGSLSVYAGRHRIRYINAEAEPVHLLEQKRMVQIAAELVQRRH